MEPKTATASSTDVNEAVTFEISKNGSSKPKRGVNVMGGRGGEAPSDAMSMCTSCLSGQQELRRFALPIIPPRCRL